MNMLVGALDGAREPVPTRPESPIC